MNLITACSRVQNLPALFQSILPGQDLFFLRWVMVLDGLAVDLPAALPGPAVVVSDPESRVGNAQKNWALDNISDGWVYFLDDDNLVHPDFFAGLAAAIQEHPAAQGFVFGQDCGPGVRVASPANVHVGGIDLAQFVLRRELIGERRFDLGRYESDGVLITEIFNEQPDAFVFLNRTLSYYNRLRCPVEMYQHPEEIYRLLGILQEIRPRRVLEVGSLYGGTLWHWIQNMAPGGTVVSVDRVVDYHDHRYADICRGRGMWPAWAQRAGVELRALEGNSHDAAIIEAASAGGPFDFIFIDGDHSLEGVRADFENYFPMLRPGGVMAFHDICYPDQNADQIDVGRWWRELRAGGQYCTEEIVRHFGQQSWGIGVIYA